MTTLIFRTRAQRDGALVRLSRSGMRAGASGVDVITLPGDHLWTGFFDAATLASLGVAQATTAVDEEPSL